MGKVFKIDLNEMKLNEYQEKAKATLKKESNRLDYLTLGLTGEAGEVAEKVKKIIRDNAGELSREKVLEIIMELGDVLWYVALLSDFLGFRLNDVAELNLAKLRSRKERGKISGNGDNR